MNKKKQNLRPVDAPLYRYWQALYLTFYSRRLYVDVAKRWHGYGVLYLLFVISLASIPLSARIIFHFNQYFNEQMLQPLEELPPLYVQDGKVVLDKPMPYIIKNKTGDIVAIVDTTGSVTGISKKYPQLTVLITKDKLYFRPPKFPLFLTESAQSIGDNTYVQTLNKNTNEVFVGKEWVESSGILRVKLVAELFVYPVMTGFVFGLYLGIMLFLAFVGQLFSIIIFKFKPSYQEACRLCLVSATPQIAVFFALHTANIVPPGERIFYMIVLSIYFSYALLSVRRESKQMVLG